MRTPRRTGGLTHVLAATVVGGAAAYALTLWAGIRLGEDYTPFAVFWSALYLVVGALSGVQQEITRATRPLAPGEPQGRTTARRFAAGAAIVVAVVALASSPAWVGAVFGGHALVLAVPLAVGLAGYVVVAVLSGVFYGLSIWRAVGAMIAVDGLVRLALTGLLLLVTTDAAVLVWAVVAPFVLVPAGCWLVFRRRVVGRYRLDVDYRTLTANVAKTVVGALATGVLVSGFPLLVATTSSSVPAARLAAVLFVITIARAPVIIIVLSLQSYFVLRFRDVAGSLARVILPVLALVAGGTLVIALVSGLVGPWLLGTVIGRDFVVEGPLVAAIVGSGGLVAALCVTGPAALSLSRHAEAALGLITAAAVTVVVLVLPLPFELRLVIALYAGPLAGLAVHAVALALPSRRSVARD